MSKQKSKHANAKQAIAPDIHHAMADIPNAEVMTSMMGHSSLEEWAHDQVAQYAKEGLYLRNVDWGARVLAVDIVNAEKIEVYEQLQGLGCDCGHGALIADLEEGAMLATLLRMPGAIEALERVNRLRRFVRWLNR